MTTRSISSKSIPPVVMAETQTFLMVVMIGVSKQADEKLHRCVQLGFAIIK